MGVASRVAPLVPERLMRVLRHAVNDDAAITRVDDSVRRKYLDRIAGRGSGE
jgi:hypothetical protein